jgi:hypothetical protein
MLIVLKPKLDRTGEPYWTAMVMHEGNCVLEVHAPKTFSMQLNKDFRETYENVAMRVFKELEKEPDQKTLRKLLLSEEVRPKNNPIQS